MANEYEAFEKRTLFNKVQLAFQLGQLFMGPQGPAAAEIMGRIMKNQKSSDAVDLWNTFNIHLRRSYRDSVLKQLSGESES